MTRRLVVEADGGSRGNPGPAGYGALVRDAKTGELLAEVSESIGRATNNVAEYSGLIAGLRAAAEIDPGAEVEARMDSKLVVEQMSGRWKIKHPGMRPLALAASEAARSFGRVSYVWVPRERNAHADRLANEAMDAERERDGGASRPFSLGPAQGPGVTAQGTSGTAQAAPGWIGAQGQPTVTLLLRHGQTPLSTEKRFAGARDIPLTQTGMQQAKVAAARLAARGGIDVIITSPLQRARRTAEEAAAATGAPVLVDEGIREADFGEWEGLSFAETQDTWPAELAAWLADPGVAPPGGESFAAVSRRVLAMLGQVLGAHEGETVLIVSHVTPIKTLVRHALLAPPSALYRMHLDVASLSQVDWYADGPAVVRSFNDTAHLADGYS